MASPHFKRYSANEIWKIREKNLPYYVFPPTIFLTHGLSNPEPADWPSLLADEVLSCWLAAREKASEPPSEEYTENRHQWIIILELSYLRTVTIELKQADVLGNTIIICRPGPPAHLEDDIFDGFELLQGYASSYWGHVNVELDVKNWLNYLEFSGLARYRLNNHRGHRHWINAVIERFSKRFYPQRILPSIENEIKLLRTWKSGNAFHGIQNEPIMAGEVLKIKRASSHRAAMKRHLAGGAMSSAPDFYQKIEVIKG
ncbi:hypothetical protein F4804DRAFT_350357 [Jackrogersella minutella]|nr:hypothetical protein F4804DRAFT_350357 [Jackrogersella minutella]